MNYIRIDTKTKQAKKFVELIETMPFAEILNEPNRVTKNAMDYAKKGNITKHKNGKELVTFLSK